MPKDVEARIRALPGNKICCDCSNINPQWASVSYGCLMCLECSGHHRNLGVHLSFVRSIAMDSWTDKQIQAMERSGGNDKLVEFFKSKGIEKNMPVHQKYATKQAEYYKNRLSRWLEGKTEPPPDPGRYDPVSGSEAQGAEPLPGETTEQYNARQARLREAARERMRAKFGAGGMSGIGPGGAQSFGSGGGREDEDKGWLGGAVSGVGSFLKNNVIENESLRSTVGGVASGVGSVAGGALSAAKRTVIDNADDDGNILQKGLSMGVKVGGGLFSKVSDKLGYDTGPSPADLRRHSSAPTTGSSGLSQDDEDFFASIGQKSRSNSTANAMSPATNGRGTGGTARKVSSSDMFKADDDWGEWGDTSAAPAPKVGNGAVKNGGSSAPAPAPKPVSVPEPTPAPAATPMKQPEKLTVNLSPIEKKPKEKAKLKDADDFFSEFDVM